VTLVSGPVHLDPPAGADVVPVASAQDMLEAVLDRLAQHQIFVGVAAVADYRVSRRAEQKIKKSRDGATLVLELSENADIIATVARHRCRPFVVGFAAETENVLVHAREKLVRKGLDMIVVNDVADRRIGFESENNAVTIVTADTTEVVPLTDKLSIARTLVARIGAAYRERQASAAAGES
jgi:phosphopantothenoylcysteine decarboxylase/phosphopantothenate--cysteine ligase